jgi:hypothetical protein
LILKFQGVCSFQCACGDCMKSELAISFILGLDEGSEQVWEGCQMYYVPYTCLTLAKHKHFILHAIFFNGPTIFTLHLRRSIDPPLPLLSLFLSFPFPSSLLVKFSLIIFFKVSFSLYFCLKVMCSLLFISLLRSLCSSTICFLS